MSAPQLKSERDAEHILNLCKTSAKRKGCRVKRLEGQDARDSVVNAAAWRLILNQRRFGNIRDFIEGNFWHEDGDARNKLVSLALDAERKAYTRAGEASGGAPVGGLPERATWENLARYVDGGLSFEPGFRQLPANSVTDEIEREELEAERDVAEAAREQTEAAEKAAREQIEAEENARFKQAVAVYERKLRRTHRAALRLVCGPRLQNGVIAVRCGVADRTVAKIRADVCDMADAILTIPKDELDDLVALAREVERLQAENAVLQEERRRERRRERWLAIMSPEDYEAYRTSTFFASACKLFGTTADAILGAAISGPKLESDP